MELLEVIGYSLMIIVFIVMIGNLIYLLFDLRRMNKQTNESFKQFQEIIDKWRNENE